MKIGGAFHDSVVRVPQLPLYILCSRLVVCGSFSSFYMYILTFSLGLDMNLKKDLAPLSPIWKFGMIKVGLGYMLRLVSSFRIGCHVDIFRRSIPSGHSVCHLVAIPSNCWRLIRWASPLWRKSRVLARGGPNCLAGAYGTLRDHSISFWF